jgi:hypothetical protein
MVINAGNRMQAVQPEVGVPQGRGTGPTLYACGATEYADCMQIESSGVGLDPPAPAVHAYHLAKDGSDVVEPNDVLAQELASAYTVNGQSATLTMVAAGNDCARLRILDLFGDGEGRPQTVPRRHQQAR